jgi:hypothetical protein
MCDDVYVGLLHALPSSFTGGITFGGCNITMSALKAFNKLQNNKLRYSRMRRYTLTLSKMKSYEETTGSSCNDNAFMPYHHRSGRDCPHKICKSCKVKLEERYIAAVAHNSARFYILHFHEGIIIT